MGISHCLVSYVTGCGCFCRELIIVSDVCEFSMQAFVRKMSSLLDTPFYEGFLCESKGKKKQTHNKWILKNGKKMQFLVIKNI